MDFWISVFGGVRSGFGSLDFGVGIVGLRLVVEVLRFYQELLYGFAGVPPGGEVVCEFFLLLFV